MASRIDTLISKCRSWDEFVELVNALPKTKNKEKGDLFERLTQVYLQTQPTYRSKLKNVYLLSDKTIPERLRAKLNLPDNDEGIDLVCETYSGEYWSVQCKYKSDQSAALTYKELSTFNSLSFNACKGISLGLVAHTSTKPVKKSHLMPMVNEIGLEKWLEISDADWKQIISVCRSNRLKPPKKRSPRRHQKAAIADAYNHFVTKKQKRGKLIMPCGTGKSLTAYWIAQALEAKTIVVAVPSLALVRQSLADWTAEYLAEGVIPEWLAVCSDHSVGSMGDADSTVATAYEMGIPTNPSDEELDNFLKKRSKAPKIVFTTYQSAEKLCDASRRNNKTFDLLIADEAHKTVGRKSKSFATLLFDENIKVKRRLFMTATERVYNASRDDVVSMDDPDIYGSTCHQLSFKEAIKQKIICDYKIVTIAVSDAEINTLIQEKADLSVSAGNKTIETDAHSLAAGIAMQKAFKKYGIKHAITFHSSIKRADSFKSQQEDLPNNAHISHSHVSSKLSAGQRANLLKRFAEEECSLVTNARCLTEGVDIKAIDCVAFVDPKQSTVDIVQAAGRAMRLSKETGKECGYIILPICIDKGEGINDLAKSEKFGKIAKIIAALSTQDERISERMNLLKGKKRNGPKIVNIDPEITDEFSTSYKEIEECLTTEIWTKVGKANWARFDEARTFVRQLGLKNSTDWSKYCQGNLENFSPKPPNIPSAPNTVYRNEWVSVGDWLGTGYVAAQNRVYKSFDEARNWARSQNFASLTEWKRAVLAGMIPDDIPSKPNDVYINSGWLSMGDWLGNGIRRPSHIQIKPFKSARTFVRSLKLKSSEEWREYIKSGKLPADITKTPERAFKGKGWSGFPDWLGYTPKRFRPYKKAQAFVQSLGVDSGPTLKKYWKLNGKPDDIPSAPAKAYKDAGWIDWLDYLGKTSKFTTRKWRPFEEAKTYVRGLNLKSLRDWQNYSSSGKRPTDIPAAPADVYSDQEWKGFTDWLGTEVEFKNFEGARSFARTLNLRTKKDWLAFYKKKECPIDIPRRPEKVYAEKGWISYKDFLGNDFLTFDKARLFARKLKLKTLEDWKKFVKSGELPADIPKAPWDVYKDSGWINLADFLNTGHWSSVDFVKFEDARTHARALGLASVNEWRAYSQSGEKPPAIPATPHQVYKKTGWLGWHDFLGKK